MNSSARAPASGAHSDIAENGAVPVTVALDAMGADFEPECAARAAAQALEVDALLSIRLLADPETLERSTTLQRRFGSRFAAVESGDFIAMDSSPAEALRRGRESSMALAVAEAASGRADAVVSSGNTGALMALARSGMGMLSGIERPALMTEFPVRGGSVWVLDLGANVGVDAERLSEFALLGNAAVSAMLGRRPKIALLNIGSEPSKGPDVVREAARRCSQMDLEFVGFVEGHDIFAGNVDVVVCDGFAGNVLLKASEGAIGMLLDEVRAAAGRWLAGPGLRRLSRELGKRYDPESNNGASLLGINGIVIKSHAHASIDGLAHAIGVAAAEVRRGMLPELERQLWASV